MIWSEVEWFGVKLEWILGVDVLDLLRCDVICILKENQMEKFQSIDSQF